MLEGGEGHEPATQPEKPEGEARRPEREKP